MRRVFPRGNLRLLCQRCALEGVETPAGVQGGTLALCWPCFKKQEREKFEYKEDLGRRFNECFSSVIITDDDDWDEDEIEDEDEPCHF